MKVTCAWCKKDMGTKEPLDDPSVTHAICKACLKKQIAKLDELKKRREQER